MVSTQVDRLTGLRAGVAIKAPCRAATNENITLFGLQTIDGVALADGDRVLVKSQSSGAENGIYFANDDAVWARTPDFDSSNDVIKGTQVFVTSGAVLANRNYSVSSDGEIVLDTTALVFEVVGGGGWELVSNQQPTSDVATVDAAGLAGYRLVKIVIAAQVSTGSNNYLMARTSGGTWRTILDLGSAPSSNDKLMAWAEISNFNAAGEKIVFGRSFSEAGILDASDAANLISDSSGGHSRAGYSSWPEVWDELRFNPSGDMQGATADQRGRIMIWGQA